MFYVFVKTDEEARKALDQYPSLVITYLNGQTQLRHSNKQVLLELLKQFNEGKAVPPVLIDKTQCPRDRTAAVPLKDRKKFLASKRK